jgi:hypothetical protein
MGSDATHLMTYLLPTAGILLLLGGLGIAVSVWLRAVRLRQLDDVPLSAVEREHPHIPSLESIVSLAGCYVSFLVIVVVALLGDAALTTAEWLLPICVLTLSGGMSIISELYSQQARLAFVGLSLGGVAALTALVIKQTAGGPAPWSFVLLCLSLVGLGLGLLVDLRRPDGLHTHHWPVVLTNIFWLLLWMLQ